MTKPHQNKNQFGQLLGNSLPDWQAPPAVQTAALTQQMQGRHCLLEPLQAQHCEGLRQAFSQASASLWTYLPYGPLTTLDDFEQWVSLLNKDLKQHNFSYCIRSLEHGQPLGVSAYLRTQAEAGSIEIGHLSFSPLLQQTTAATEALFMMIDAVFALGYRRCEWKCNALNEPSIRAAKRLGFRYEGTFRQAQVVKGCNRDTAWFSILDSEWQELKPCYEEWLDSRNFDQAGQQCIKLSTLTHKVHSKPSMG